MSVKLRLDENLSPRIAELLRQRGIDAVAVRDRGLLRATDAEVFERAYAEDRIVVTINVGDFEKLARQRELHAGVVLVEPSGLLRDEQAALVDVAIAAIIERGDLVNTVLRVGLDGSITFESLPN